MSEHYMEKMKELGISEEVVNQVLAVAKRMDDKGLVNSFAGNISAKPDKIKAFSHRRRLLL